MLHLRTSIWLGGAAILLGGLISACAPRGFNQGSDTTATSQDNGQNGQQMRCNVIYPSVKAVGTDVLRQVVAVSRNRSASNSTAQRLADQTVRMLENMTRHATEPIHPIGFFAVVKDFESASSVNRWGRNGFNFTTSNCTSGTCSGYFQVDVALESDWRGGAVCQSGGLNIWNKSGGPDFCAGLFWWLEANGGVKCNQLGPGNPCKDANYTWTANTFGRGYLAYVQQPQWGDNSWAKMYNGGTKYGGYRQCILNSEGGNMRVAVDKFLAEIGMVAPEELCKEITLFQSAKKDGIQFQAQVPAACPASKFLLTMRSVNSGDAVAVQGHPGDTVSSVPTGELVLGMKDGVKIVRFMLANDELLSFQRTLTVIAARNDDLIASKDFQINPGN